MPYELTCPSCGARLQLDDEDRREMLICSRCTARIRKPTPHAEATYGSKSSAIAAGAPEPATTHQDAVTATPPSRHGSEPVVSDSSTGPGIKPFPLRTYCTLLLANVVAIAAVIAIGFPGTRLGLGPPDGRPDLNMGWVALLDSLIVSMTALIVYPVGVWLYRVSSRSRKRGGSVILTAGLAVAFAVLIPMAAFLVFLTVCGTALYVTTE